MTVTGNFPITESMTDAPTINDDAIRQSLLRRAEIFRAETKISFSRISEDAVKDSKFLARVANGGNFTISTYQRVMDWLDAAEREIAR